MHTNQNNSEQAKEGFPKQRLVVMPASVIQRCRALPLVSQLYVTDIGSFPLAPQHYVKRETGIPQSILICCLSGKGSLKAGGKSYSAEPGHVMFIPPHTPHIYSADSEKPWSLFWIHFDGQHSETVLQSLSIGNSPNLIYVPDVELMRNAFEDVYATLNYHHSDAGLLAMTSELMRLLSKIKLQQGHLQQQRQTAENRITDSLVFMAGHLDMSLTVAELATQAGQSVAYYSKLFRERTNQSPMAWFIQLKIRKACELLDQTDLSIREIANKLGYEDPYYFSRLFKKFQGQSPSSYRSTVKG